MSQPKTNLQRKLQEIMEEKKINYKQISETAPLPLPHVVTLMEGDYLQRDFPLLHSIEKICEVFEHDPFELIMD